MERKLMEMLEESMHEGKPASRGSSGLKRNANGPRPARHMGRWTAGSDQSDRSGDLSLTTRPSSQGSARCPPLVSLNAMSTTSIHLRD